MDYGCARSRRGSPTAHPWACGELAGILPAILWTAPSSARRVRGAPLGAHRVRATGEATWQLSLRARPRMAVGGRQTRRWRCRSRNADRAGKARMSDCRDAGVRAGARSASGKGNRTNTTFVRSPPQAQWSLVTFCRNRKSLARRRRTKPLYGEMAEPDTDVEEPKQTDPAYVGM